MTAPRKYRRRYIAFRIKKSSQMRKKEDPLSELKRELESFPYSWVIMYDRGKEQGLIKCDHRKVEKLLQKVGENEDVKILGVSGTIRNARKKFLSGP